MSHSTVHAILRTNIQKSIMSLFKNDMKTHHTLGFAVWLPKQLLLSDRMTQKIP
jgi:hypothetical protein